MDFTRTEFLLIIAAVDILLVASLIAFFIKHRRAGGVHIEIDPQLEYDPVSAVYRLRVRNKGKRGITVCAKLVRVLDKNGRPHPDSARLPLRLQWMHWPDRLSIALVGEEKVDVMFCCNPLGETLDEVIPQPFLQAAGETFHDFYTAIEEQETVYCRVAFYESDANQEIASRWCMFARHSETQSGYQVMTSPGNKINLQSPRL